MLVLIDVIKTEMLSFSAKTIWGQSRMDLTIEGSEWTLLLPRYKQDFEAETMKTPLDFRRKPRYHQIPLGILDFCRGRNSGRSRVAWKPCFSSHCATGSRELTERSREHTQAVWILLLEATNKRLCVEEKNMEKRMEKGVAWQEVGEIASGWG